MIKRISLYLLLENIDLKAISLILSIKSSLLTLPLLIILLYIFSTSFTVELNIFPFNIPSFDSKVGFIISNGSGSVKSTLFLLLQYFLILFSIVSVLS